MYYTYNKGVSLKENSETPIKKFNSKLRNKKTLLILL